MRKRNEALAGAGCTDSGSRDNEQLTAQYAFTGRELPLLRIYYIFIAHRLQNSAIVAIFVALAFVRALEEYRLQPVFQPRLYRSAKIQKFNEFTLRLIICCAPACRGTRRLCGVLQYIV